MTHSQSRTELAKGNVTPEVKQQLKVLAADKYECSQSAAIQEIIQAEYHQTYGDLDTQAIQEDRIDDETLEAVKTGEVDPAELDDAVRSNGGETQRVAASDGGVEPHPESYHPTVGPDELQEPGRELTWDELKDAVADERWSEDLVIHPERVPEDELRQRHKPTSRVLAAIARAWNATDMVSGDDLDDIIERYLSHQHDRFDHEEGMAYLNETYRPKITAHLWASPKVDSEIYYTTKEAHDDAMVMIAEDDPGMIDHPDEILSLETWSEGRDLANTRVAKAQWKADVAEWLANVVTLKRLCKTPEHRTPLFDRDVDHPDEYNEPVQYLKTIYKNHLKAFDQIDDRYTRANYRDELLDEVVTEEVAEEFRDAAADGFA